MLIIRTCLLCLIAICLLGAHVVLAQSYPTWTQSTNLTISGATLTKTTSQTAWDAGALSVEYTNGNGWVEFSFAVQKDAMMGLSNYNTAVGPTFNYGIYAHMNGFLYVRENGVEIPEIGKDRSIQLQYTASDVLRVERTGAAIQYKKNGVTFYTSTIPSIGPLHVDCSLGLYQAAIIVRNLSWLTTWTGVIDHDWHKGGNWSANRVPTPFDQVTITACTTCPELNANTNIAALKMLAGSRLTIGTHLLSIETFTSIIGGRIYSVQGAIYSKDFTEMRTSSVIGAIAFVKTGGMANTWHGGNYFSPEVQLVNKSNQPWKLSTLANNEVIKDQPSAGNNPTEIPGLHAWWKWKTDVTSSSGIASAWNDQSGHGYHMTQSTSTKRPRYDAISGAFMPDGVNDFFRANAVINEPGGEVTAVIEVATVSNYGPILSKSTWPSSISDDDAIVLIVTSGKTLHKSILVGSGNPVTSVNTLPATTKVIVSWSYGTTGRLWINGIQCSYVNQSNANWLGSGNNTFMTLFTQARPTPYQYTNAKVYEVSYHNHELTATERANLTAYLKGKHSIP